MFFPLSLICKSKFCYYQLVIDKTVFLQLKKVNFIIYCLCLLMFTIIIIIILPLSSKNQCFLLWCSQQCLTKHLSTLEKIIYWRYQLCSYSVVGFKVQKLHKVSKRSWAWLTVGRRQDVNRILYCHKNHPHKRLLQTDVIRGCRSSTVNRMC